MLSITYLNEKKWILFYMFILSLSQNNNYKLYVAVKFNAHRPKPKVIKDKSGRKMR